MANSGEVSPLDSDIASIRRREQADYRFESIDGYCELGEKTFVAMIGPTKSGKTLLTDAVIKLEPEFAPYGVRTTRARKPTDPENFLTANEGITHQSMNQDIINHRLVNYSVLDTGHMYGTTPEDIDNYAIGTISGVSIENLSTAGFKKFHPVFILARGAIYQHRLEQARKTLPDINARLLEATEVLSFARSCSDDLWVNFIDTGNTAEELDSAAQTIRTITHQGTHPFMTTDYILQLISEMERAVQNVASQVGE